MLAHNINCDKIQLKHWKIEKENKSIEGTFYMLRDGNVFIEDEQNNVIAYPLTSLSAEDQEFALYKNERVNELNSHRTNVATPPVHIEYPSNVRFWIVLILITALGIFILKFIENKKLKYIVPVLLVGVTATLYSYTTKIMHSMQSMTSPTFIDSAFVPFVPHIHTFWDESYFYVESYGIPTTHEMMVGISNHGWQQQVPIPQCYIGVNAWPIPLNPVIASVSIPVDSIHFTRGAIALAVNGVPIFNVHTNTGVDSYLDGQLDSYGGHCGRADDYHYHLAPLHLYEHTNSTLPIAFGLDGFAVYGSVEPDGTPMQTLDANHGHLFNGVYHYHGTTEAPYMIANMVGEVTEDASNQLIPQAHAQPVRPALTPLNGALITGCTPNGTNNGYSLSYTLSGQTDSVVYFWNTSGLYTFNFFTAGNGTNSTQTYNGFTQCVVPTTTNDLFSVENNIVIYPNPNNGVFHLQLNSEAQRRDVKEISIYNLQGELIFQVPHYQSRFDIMNIEKGTYIMRVQLSENQIIQKFLVY